MDKSLSPLTARLRRRVPVLFCRKCLKRAGNGSDMRKALKDALKQRGRAQDVKPKLLATACFGICPKHAIVVATGSTLARGEVVVIRDAATADETASILLIANRDPA